MKTGDLLHGFRVTARKELPGIEAVMWRMVYEKTGTETVWFERADDNKTFAISFCTTPEDSTGVFHILEHSVLCGSDKFPVKEPFVELLKGSLQTFLNAMTYPDKTVYPVSSRNGKDFLNLVDVYLDAVFHPAILDNPDIFRQEGWHFEFDENGTPAFSGVVYNEMKGAYSSPDDLTGEYLSRLIYKNSLYGYDSGGDPEVIPTLTYEKFLETHRRFYHPSAAHIFLDGEIDLDATLSLLDDALRGFEKSEGAPVITVPPLTATVSERVFYEIGEDEDPEGKARFALAFPAFRFDDERQMVAFRVLSGVLCGSNDAPLKAALVGAGLCEDVYLYLYDDVYAPAVFLEVVNAKEKDLEKIRQVIDETFRRVAKEGFDPDEIEATLSSLEFRMRERDYGSYPRGIIYALAALGPWNYGGEPDQGFWSEQDIDALRAMKGTPYYTDLLTKLFIDCQKRAELTLLPSKTLADERAAAEAKRARDLLAAEGEGAAERERAVTAALHERQSTPDTPEALATLPTLKLSDIERKPPFVPTEDGEVGGVRVLRHPLATCGIDYLELRFDASDLRDAEIGDFALFVQLFTLLPTERDSLRALTARLKRTVGSMTVSSAVCDSDEGLCLHARVALSLLESKREEAADLLRDVLYTTDFADHDEIRRIVRQMRTELGNDFSAGGHSMALDRVDACFTASGAFIEKAEGYAFYRYLRDLDDHFDERADALTATFRAFADRFFRQERLLVASTGKMTDDAVRIFTDRICTGGTPAGKTSDIAPFGVRREGIVVPAQVCFAVAAAQKKDVRAGSYLVARNILTNEYLWNRVRVQGGAYGTGFGARKTGLVFFYSYRDPNGARSLDVYRGAAKFLSDYAEGGEDFDKYIIGAIASAYPITTPRTDGAAATSSYLRGETYEDACREREEILTTDKAALLAVARDIAALFSDPAVSVVGGKEQIDALGDRVTEILKL